MIVNGNNIDLIPETASNKQTGVFKVGVSKMLERVTKFTDIEISPINSMVFNVEETGESFRYFNGTLETLKNKNVLPKGYIFNQDKMPLMDQRYGFLPDKLNTLLLNSSENILDGEVRLDANVFLRKGVEKIINIVSFLLLARTLK